MHVRIPDYQKLHLKILGLVPSSWSSATEEAIEYDKMNAED